MVSNILTALLILVMGSCQSYKFLMISPLTGKSHAILGDGVVRHLLIAGHEITYITAFPENMSHKNLTIIDVSANKGAFKSGPISIKNIMDKEINIQDLSFLIQTFEEVGRRTLSNKFVQELLKDDQHFDGIIAEWMFTEVYAGFSAVYDCPLIWLSTIEPHWMVLQLIDEAPNPAHTPDCLTTHVPPFTFWQRTQELLNYYYGRYIQYRYAFGLAQVHYEQYIVPHIKDVTKPVPTLDVLRYNASLMLGNSHFSLGQPSRLPQNYKPIAGYHINDIIKPLPEDLKTLMDNAKNGVIYFSMGSNLNSGDFPQELKDGFLKFFGELKQTVIWKFEDELQNRPENLHILKWAPQQSILAHPNCILFITHGGLLSTTEAIHFGVPIIGIPVFGDQFTNIERAINKGFTKKVTLSYTILKDFKEQIASIIYDPKYAAKAKELSQMYHSRPVPPAVELVHWVEHVVKTRGAPHLRSPALHMPLYQKCYLDLLAVVLVFLTAVSYVVRKIFSLCKKTSVDDRKKYK